MNDTRQTATDARHVPYYNGHGHSIETQRRADREPLAAPVYWRDAEDLTAANWTMCRVVEEKPMNQSEMAALAETDPETAAAILAAVWELRTALLSWETHRELELHPFKWSLDRAREIPGPNAIGAKNRRVANALCDLLAATETDPDTSARRRWR